MGAFCDLSLNRLIWILSAYTRPAREPRGSSSQRRSPSTRCSCTLRDIPYFRKAYEDIVRFHKNFRIWYCVAFVALQSRPLNLHKASFDRYTMYYENTAANIAVHLCSLMSKWICSDKRNKTAKGYVFSSSSILLNIWLNCFSLWDSIFSFKYMNGWKCWALSTSNIVRQQVTMWVV